MSLTQRLGKIAILGQPPGWTHLPPGHKKRRRSQVQGSQLRVIFGNIGMGEIGFILNLSLWSELNGLPTWKDSRLQRG